MNAQWGLPRAAIMAALRRLRCVPQTSGKDASMTPLAGDSAFLQIMWPNLHESRCEKHIIVLEKKVMGLGQPTMPCRLF